MKTIQYFLTLIVLFSFVACKDRIKSGGALDVPMPPMTRTYNANIQNKASFVIKGPSNALAYIERYKYIAISECLRTGIPASMKLAQGCLESSYGSSDLAQRANNHFGIKHGGNWTGETVQHSTEGDLYRKFEDGDDAFVEHSNFLTNRSRYSHLFKIDPRDYRSWIRGVKEAGYAEDPAYPNKIIDIIERYKLYKYDYSRSGEPSTGLAQYDGQAQPKEPVPTPITPSTPSGKVNYNEKI